MAADGNARERAPPPPANGQLEGLVRTTPGAWLLSGLGAVICYLSFEGPDSTALTAWLAAFAAVGLARLATALWAVHVQRRWLTDQRFQPAWLASTYVHAAQWGLLSVVLARSGSAEAEAILHVTLAAVAMGGAVRLPGFPRTMHAHVLLVLGPLVLRDLVLASAQQALLAFLVALIGAYALLSGRNQGRALDEIDQQRRRNAKLIDALRRENERTEAALDAARRASAARTRFFAAANHDLRQPLHAMGLMLETLKARPAEARAERIVDHLAGCVDGMGEVVDDLLEITRVDGGQHVPQWSTFEADVAIREACRPYELAARSKGLEFHVGPADAYLCSDRGLVQRALANLVANAVRYTPRGAVRITAEREGERLRIRVADTGLGIDARFLPHVFDEFYQVGNPARDRRLGLGLGLAIVRRISDLLSLQVAVQSTPGVGSEFSFTVPIMERAADVGLVLPPPPESRLALRRILVVEDDADSRDALAGLLRTWGCEPRCSADLAGAIAALDAGFAPDAAVVDLRLADGAGGLEVVVALRARLGPSLPVVIATGDAGAESTAEARARGLAVMIKPVRPVQLRAFLGRSFSSGA